MRDATAATPTTGRNAARAGRMALVFAVAAALLSAAGCGKAAENGAAPAGSVTATSGGVPSLSGGADPVRLPPEWVGHEPERWKLTDPESSVRSYLDWTSYAYRIADSGVASATMSPNESVRVDSYIQYNREKHRLIDQTLQSIVFSQPSVSATRAVVPAREHWIYRYLSTSDASRTVSGPFVASYETTYTVVKLQRGWVVDSVKARALSAVR